MTNTQSGQVACQNSLMDWLGDDTESSEDIADIVCDGPDPITEPEWDEFYFDPDDTYGTIKY
jgi:hypothetical protein